MNKSPFKFFDRYTCEGHNIFFGRNREVEEIYTRLFFSNMLLL